MGDAVVKIDSELLDSVGEFIKLDSNKFKYVNRKQFIDLAVAEYLMKERLINKKKVKNDKHR